MIYVVTDRDRMLFATTNPQLAFADPDNIVHCLEDTQTLNSMNVTMRVQVLSDDTILPPESYTFAQTDSGYKMPYLVYGTGNDPHAAVQQALSIYERHKIIE